MSFKFPINSTSTSPFTRSEPFLTVEQLKERYLFGVDLSDTKGNEISPKALQHYIEAAVSYLEHKLDIVIFKTEFEERYDYRAVDYTEFNFMQLKKRPMDELFSLKAKFPNNVELVDYPKEWFVVEKEGAQIQISPVEGTFSGLIVTQGGSHLPLIYGTQSYWPHLFEVKYSAGFDPDKIPVIINELIGLQAAIRVFEILGDITLGPGIASESVGLDGATVSKGTTASAMFSAFSARVESYKKQVDEYMKVVKNYYNAMPMIIA